MKKHNSHINNDFKDNGMKTVKILVFFAVAIIAIIYIPFDKIDLKELSENISIFFEEVLTPENKHWLVENQYIILIGGGLLVFMIINGMSNYYNSKEYKKIKKQRKQKVEKTTSNFVIAVIIILVMFFLIKSDILFKSDTESSSEKTLLSMKKAPFVDFESSEIEIEDTTVTALYSDYEIETTPSREYTQVSQDQCYENFKDDYYFKQYLTFYFENSYMYNMKYLNTWFTEEQINQITKFYKP